MDTENKYKKGDWVRCIDDSDTAVVRVGEIYKIHNADRYFIYTVDRPAGGMYLHRFEPWQPKVGERVRVAKHVNSYGDPIRMDLPIGSVHTVTRVGDALSNKDRPSFTLSGSDVHFYLVENLEPVTDTLPVAEQPAALTIQAGKFYKTRDGRKVGPMVARSWGGFFDDSLSVTSQHWSASGTFIEGCISNLDLIAEWVDTPVAQPVTNHAATVDAINDEYGPVVREVPVLVAEQPARFKVGDRVVERNYLGDGVDCFGTVLSVSDDGTTVYAEDWTAGVKSGSLCIDYLELVVAADTQPQQARPMIRTKNGYGFELARVGDYVWVDIGQKALITVRADTIKAA